PFTGDSLRAHEAFRRAVVQDAELLRGDLLTELSHEGRAGRVEDTGIEPRHDDVVQDLHQRLAPEDDPVVACRHAHAADAGDGIAGGLLTGVVSEAGESRRGSIAASFRLLALDHR